MMTGASRGVTVPVICIDKCPAFGYDNGVKQSRSLKDASHLTAAGGASAVPAGEGSSPLLSGGSGISLPAL